MTHDLYAQVTERIVASLERGVAPWVIPWSAGIDALPMNASSRRAYRGVNVVLLALEAQANGYALNRWLSYRQAEDLGGQVRRGARGVQIVFWKLRKVSATADAYPDAGETDLHDRVVPLLRCYTVFNVNQVDGLPKELFSVVQPTWEPEARAEELILMSGARIRHGGAVAFYQPVTDEIHLPPRRWFPEASRFYATAFHELVHWCSHPSRCNRQLGGRYGDAAYAMEELIAELGAAFLSGWCKIDSQLEHAASYIDSWLTLLRKDARALIVASAKAQQACDYLLRLCQPPDLEAKAA